MGLLNAVVREYRYLTGALRTLGRLRSVKADSPRLATDDLETSVDRHADQPAFIFEGREMSYREFDAYANQVAHWADAQGITRGDTVALFMLNRPEYIAIWFGLSKLGVVTALINNQLTGSGLAHCINIAEVGHVIVDAEIADLIPTAIEHFDQPYAMWSFGGATAGYADFDASVAAQSTERPPRARRAGMVGGDMALKLYTSGTTGMPKAAKVTHVRVLTYMNAFAASLNSHAKDRMMMVLPLYHATGGLVGVGVVLVVGGCVILEKKFSASRFWDVAADNGATLFTYVGELCRILVQSPPHPKERHALRGAVGNGLRPDVWPRFQERFNVPWIIEFYGSTEGNVSLVNFDGKQGSIGRVPPYLAHRFNTRIVKFNHETEMPVRDADGRCILAEVGEVGEAIGEIRANDARYQFAGYAGAEEETQKKVLTDVFADGDRWFRTGDLLSVDKHGYYAFIDRVGDTFRWKSENVSTNEVAAVLGVASGVAQANVYGVEVPGHDGRAGMAALVSDGALDLTVLHADVHEHLPHYARPVFLRVYDGAGVEHTTGTFKLKKTDLVGDGFDPAHITDQLYVDDPRTGAYVALDAALYDDICAGRFRL